MLILIAGSGRRRFLQRFSMDECDRRRPLSLATRNLHHHRSISMVEEPTKTLQASVHGALAFFRGASCQFLVIKICKTRDPIDFLIG
jgi:hypothetical protein